jgi:hypothetical protein
MTPTQPPPPPTAPGPPPGPPSGPPPPPPSAPPKKAGGGIWLVGFIVATVLFVIALVFAIVSFLGKNDESDKKKEAQEQLASTRRERDRLQEQLGGAQQTGQTLRDLLTQAASAADDLKACTDASGNFIEQFGNAVGQIVAGGGVPPELQSAASDTDTRCAASDQAYQELIDALRQAQSE